MNPERRRRGKTMKRKMNSERRRRG